MIDPKEFEEVESLEFWDDDYENMYWDGVDLDQAAILALEEILEDNDEWETF